MDATMMDFPLTLPAILDHGRRLHGGVEIVSRRPDKSLHRYRYADMGARARALAEMLIHAGLKRGDRVATLMWSHDVHLEAYFGVPLAGGVLHTLNLRLHPDDIAYIANHAGDRFLIVDDVLLPLLDQFKDRADFERIFVVPLSGAPVAAGYEDYEAFIAEATGRFTPPDIGENDACGMCYTSGTTGRPKGVVYSHRALVLHSFAVALPDATNLSMRQALTPVVPMFHVNAWGLPLASVMVGTKLVFPGPHLDAESLIDLFEREQVTLSAGVPTIWLGLAAALKKRGTAKLHPDLTLLVGGAACPESLIRAFAGLGIKVIHAWGMTEMSPVGTAGALRPEIEARDADARFAIQATQGMPLPFVEARVVNDDGVAPWDGKTMGELQVRGPWVAAGYYAPEDPVTSWTDDGWFRTGDVVTILPEGYIKITDRTKDLIKSGGEWISSQDIENALMGHPAVREAAVIAVSHPKWQERPLACVVLGEEAAATADELKAFLAERFATWWVPDAIEFIEEIPKTSTGKFKKLELRERFKDYRLEV